MLADCIHCGIRYTCCSGPSDLCTEHPNATHITDKSYHHTNSFFRSFVKAGKFHSILVVAGQVMGSSFGPDRVASHLKLLIMVLDVVIRLKFKSTRNVLDIRNFR